MNETKNNIGNYSATRRKKAKTTTPTTYGICRMDEVGKRQFGNKERQAEIGSGIGTSHAFLKTCFMPKLKEDKIFSLEDKLHITKIERGFYKSLSLLTKHYGIRPLSTHDFNYPYNISLCLWDIQKQLKSKVQNCENIRLMEKEDEIFFVAQEHYNTGATLYYIPVIPLYQMLRNKNRKKTGLLLLSVCTYLYKIADIPYYRQEDSYLYWIYEMLTEWLEQNEEMDDNHISKKELQKAEIIGDIMEQKIVCKENLLFFEERLKQFKPKDNFDKECFLLAEKTFKLYREYPDASVFRNTYYNNVVRPEEADNDEYYNEDTVITMDKYISFFAESDGLIYDNLMDCVNNEFNEYGEAQEPIIFKIFDGSNVTDENLDFESKLFKILNELCRLLN
ncbi:hypothetical protein [Elizabethkingia anophelis]|uniref:hypothetical protein n=2 Tax=Elizabethkingia anophelis TaxID=1117645 RepID=UPI0020132C35|nr:hypothetical protein [Elizabethkingia anophelis]MCL1689451.1 hypothetical protein [Elizabethkingia anophelis]